MYINIYTYLDMVIHHLYMILHYLYNIDVLYIYAFDHKNCKYFEGAVFIGEK